MTIIYEGNDIFTITFDSGKVVELNIKEINEIYDGVENVDFEDINSEISRERRRLKNDGEVLEE